MLPLQVCSNSFHLVLSLPSFPIFFFTFMLQGGNNIKACQILQCHILALEPYIEVFKDVLQPLVEVPNPMGKCRPIRLDDEDSPLPKLFR
jgi:hypothetical protein